MSEQYEEEIIANLERADESVRAATVLFAAGYFDSAASRAYYAVFHVSTAALLREGARFAKHRGVIAGVHQKFVKTGKMDKEFGKKLDWLFELRGIGDYGETRHVSQKDAQKAIEAAKTFVRAVKEMLGRS